MKMHYWYHLDDKIVFNPGFGYVPNYRIKDGLIACAVIKIRPLAFLLADYSSSIIELKLPELKSDNQQNYFIKYDRKYFLAPDYPFNVRDDGIVIFSSKDFYYAEKVKGKKK